MNELIVIDVSGTTPKGKGSFDFKHIPHRGDWIELEEGGVASMFEVTMVAHSSNGASSDLYVRRVNVTALAVKHLCN